MVVTHVKKQHSVTLTIKTLTQTKDTKQDHAEKGLLDSANKNTGCSIKFKETKIISFYNRPVQSLGHTNTQKRCVVYLEFKWNWVSFVLLATPYKELVNS